MHPGALKRFLVGKPVASDRLGHTLLPKRLALPVFASDALSSVAYAPDEIFLTLSLAGVSAVTLSPWVALVVVIVMLVVIAAYRQNVHAYPSGGGDYEVATVNLGQNAGLTIASALLVDYVLTVAVSISSGAQYLITVVPALNGYATEVAIGAVALLAIINLRGARESGRALSLPVYLYMFSIGLMAVVGAVQYATGSLGSAPSAVFTLQHHSDFDAGLTGLAGGFLVLRAFSSGCAALTGVEAISNGVPVFRKPKSKNAATTLFLLGLIGASMLMSVVLLGRATHITYAADPATQLLRDGVPVGASYHQAPVIGQLAETVFAGARPLFLLVTIVTGFILLLAANTAFNGFPVLGSILARDGFLPRQLHTRGDRLAFSNGILALAVAAIVLIVVFDAEVTRLIQLYIVGVFVSFTTSQLGMVRHFSRELGLSTNARDRARLRRSRVVASIGFAMTGLVLIVVLITKFTHGAWLTVLLMAITFTIMNRVHAHYTQVAAQLRVQDLHAARALPSRVHAIVLVANLSKPTLRAISYARATRPFALSAVTVAVEDGHAEKLRRQWEEAELPIDLTVLASPYREITRPLVEYVRSMKTSSPRDLVVVFIPEFVVQSWWEHILHNQTALRLKSRLLFVPGVVVSSVPYQLPKSSSERSS
ncbi:MAG: APC family permease [Bowdeniella nasicola]|nr:APC family permease [Bowdeniella nasicola]